MTSEQLAALSEAAENGRASGSKHSMFSTPLNFSLSTKGIEVIGGTSSPDDLRYFIDKLMKIMDIMPNVCSATLTVTDCAETRE